MSSCGFYCRLVNGYSRHATPLSDLTKKVYLRNYIAGQEKEWVKWVCLCEYCYNTTYQLSIQVIPFMVLYGYEAPNFLDLLMSNSRMLSVGALLQGNQDIMRALKENIQRAQI